MKEIQKAGLKELESIMEIYNKARIFMKRHGNGFDWRGDYPSEEMVRQDLEAGYLHVLTNTDSKEIEAVFVFYPGPDPLFEEIRGGAWSKGEEDGNYYVFTRLASAGKEAGAGGTCLDWAKGQGRSLRTYSFRHNFPMLSLLTAQGFQYRGIIKNETGADQYAFEHKKAY